MESNSRPPFLSRISGIDASTRDPLLRIVGALLMGLALVAHWPMPWQPWMVVGVTLTALAAGMMMHVHLRQVTPKGIDLSRAEKIVFSTSLGAIIGCQFIKSIAGTSAPMSWEFLLLGPLIAQSMLTSALLGPGIAVVGLSVTAMLLGVPEVLGMEMVMAAWIAGVVGAHAVNPMKQRAHLMRALGVQVAANAVIGAAVGVVVRTDAVALGMAVLWAVVAAVGALSVFWLGLTLFERAFGLVSDLTLLELCSPEHPLLRDLVMRAPGTQAHSLGVANLAEQAAREIGANAVLVRTMAYFHDIGKTLRPGYFIENQIGQENPHDDMSPALSAQVIAAHVRDGVELGRKAKLPRVILDAIQQHHGTTLITYFFHRALTTAGETVDEGGERLERFFRYEGPKPQLKEIGILHLADQVEAAARTLPHSDGLERMIDDLFRKSLEDGQLDECDLSLRELSSVKRSFLNTLRAVRHDRIEYPDMPSKEGEDGDLGQPVVQSSPF